MTVKTHRHTQDAAHRHTARPNPADTWVEGKVTHHGRKGMGAEIADRMERQAWGTQFKSPYTHLIDIPASVPPSDHAQARSISDRILSAIEQGGWTKNEGARLHRLYDSWLLRSSGADPVFNIKGWKKQGDGHHHPPVLRLLQKLRGIVHEATDE